MVCVVRRVSCIASLTSGVSKSVSLATDYFHSGTETLLGFESAQYRRVVISMLVSVIFCTHFPSLKLNLKLAETDLICNHLLPDTFVIT